MTKEQAKQLVRETFTHRFQKDQFRRFIKELVNRYDENKAASWTKQYIPDAFKEHVERYERLGTFTAAGDGEKVDILVVHLTSESKLERARTALRNFVAHHLKSRDEKDSGLVAFVSPSEATWRFSFVKMEYVTEEKAGRVSVATHLTPARRFSYLVGEGESCHTAQSRFLSLLQNTNEKPTIDQIAECFSVETVTKDFFTRYYGLFKGLKQALDVIVGKEKAVRDEFRAKHITTDDFAKKLLGQIVFLYFIQKKGWLGVASGQEWGSGPRDFLRRLAKGEYGNYKNFFNDVLEPLFYDTLATDRGGDAWCDRFKCRIPFLNGGLFEPLSDYDWQGVDLTLANDLFVNHEANSEGDVGTGILDVFDRYNFTVNESEPLEQEVAIDPEMLGKVFENLLEAVSRKSLGTFYTPREIVHYMCQESLISYLYRAVNTGLAPLVPAKAVQGGLFGQQQAVQSVMTTPVTEEKITRDDLGALVHLGDQAAHYETALKAGTTSYEKKARPRLPKSVETHVKEIDAALRDIAVCDPAIGSGAFPVGMMTEIVRARLALNPYFQDQDDRTAYNFKRHSIQKSIYGVDIDLGAVEIAKLRLWLSLVVDEEDLTLLKPLPNLDFKIVSGNSLLGFRFVSLGLAEIEQLKAAYFDQPDHDQKAVLKETIAKRIATHIAQSEKALGYRVEFDYKLFFSEVFAKKGGFDVVIANPPYVDSERMTVEQPVLRNIYTQTFSAAKGNWDLFIVFIEQGMRQLNSGGIISYIVPNKLLGAPYADAVRELLRKRTVLEIRDYSSVNVFKEAAVYPIVFRASMEASGRPAPTMTVMSDLEDIQQSRSVPEDVFYADTSWDRYFGTEDDFAIVMKIAAFPSLVEQCKEVTAAATVSDAYEVKKLVIESGVARGRHFKRLVNTGTIDRYELLWGQQPTRYIKASYQAPVVPDAELGAMSKKRLQQAGSSKIIIGGMNKVLECALDEAGEYCAGKSTTIILDDDLDHLKFLLGILNSKVVTFWYRNYYKSMSLAGGYLRINQGELKTIPVPKPSSAQKRQVIRLVEKIMVAKQNKQTAEADKLDDALEGEIGLLYGLTTAELSVIREQYA